MPDFMYVALCLVIPPLWGVIAARLFDAMARRRKRSESPAPASTSDDEWVYHI